MQKFKLSEAGDRGWFIGAFDRSVFKTDACEVSYTANKKGEKCAPHYHKIATEITLFIRGSVHLNGMIFNAGDIVVLEPGEICDIEYLEDTESVVVKTPGALNDKYLI
jgi:quercetin dioxygenase-like cupin family protein